MRPFSLTGASCVKGEIRLLGDKSIACRAIIISAISHGKTAIENFPPNKDCLYAVRTFKKLGVKITHNKKTKRVQVWGNGLYGLKEPDSPIFVGESGTTLRLTLGVLAGQKFTVTLTAGKPLSGRPMLRVTSPLRMMGADIKSRVWNQGAKVEEYLPITITGGRLKSIVYKVPVASAQVKSAILLAGLYAKGNTFVTEPVKTRDHTERMLKLFNAGIRIKQNTIVLEGARELVSPGRIFIPGDISSASFFMVLASIVPNSRILIRDVSLNPSRLGIISSLKRMGADIKVINGNLSGFEPSGDILVKSAKLKGTVIRKKEIPSLIDELPILMVAASFAQGKSVFEGVSELRIKETDRIRSMFENLTKLGAGIKILKTLKSERIIIHGARILKGAKVKSFADHRTAMSMVVAGFAAHGRTSLDDITCINKSFPNFLKLIKNISQ